MNQQKNILKQGEVLSHRELVDHFKVSFSGGIRPSNKTKTVIVISNHVESLYDDKWIDGVLHYTGTGQQGDQTIDSGNNKTLNEASVKGFEIHLFEVFEEAKYVYQGIVEQCKEPYQKLQPDKNSDVRNVWIFQLRPRQGEPILIEVDEKIKNKKIATRLKNLSADKIKLLSNKKKKKARSTQVLTTRYERDEYVVLYALKRANGICELCENSAPFKTKDDLAFLEVHHIIYLSKDGPDTVDNVAALCPNCHRKMHLLENHSDIKKLKIKASRIL
jgi:5-methylcytosine-specific restriction protein A